MADSTNETPQDTAGKQVLSPIDWPDDATVAFEESIRNACILGGVSAGLLAVSFFLSENASSLVGNEPDPVGDVVFGGCVALPFLVSSIVVGIVGIVYLIRGLAARR